MSVVAKKGSPIPFGKLGVEGGFRWYTGFTWHTTEPYLFGDNAAQGREQECFEVYWDDNGQGKVTGQRKKMTGREAEATQSVERKQR